MKLTGYLSGAALAVAPAAWASSLLVGREFDVEHLRYMARDQIQQARHLAENANAADDRIPQVTREEIPPMVRSARRARVLKYREMRAPYPDTRLSSIKERDPECHELAQAVAS